MKWAAVQYCHHLHSCSNAYFLHECTCSMASVVEKLVDDQSECDDSSDDDSSNVFEYGK